MPQEVAERAFDVEVAVVKHRYGITQSMQGREGLTTVIVATSGNHEALSRYFSLHPAAVQSISFMPMDQFSAAADQGTLNPKTDYEVIDVEHASDSDATVSVTDIYVDHGAGHYSYRLTRDQATDRWRVVEWELDWIT